MTSTSSLFDRRPTNAHQPDESGRIEDTVGILNSILPPDPEEQNEQRADAAEKALATFTKNYGEKGWHNITEQKQRELNEQNLSDLLADFGHYCDRAGINLQSRLRVAGYHYTEETDRKGTQFAPASNPLDDPSNLATVLAAVRLFQRHYENVHGDDIRREWPEQFTANNGGAIEPLSTDDIDALCVDLNSGAPAAAPAKTEPGPHDALFIAKARELYSSESNGDIDIDAAPVVSEGDGGAFVQMWGWVRDEDAGLSEESGEPTDAPE
jgi:hypothetical protein